MEKYFAKIRVHRAEYGNWKTFTWIITALYFRVRSFRAVQSDFGYNSHLKKDFIPRSQRVFIFATIPYYDIGGGQRSAQLAKVFSRMGYEVFYVYAFKSSDGSSHLIENPCCFHKLLENVIIEEIEPFLREDDLCIFEAPCKEFLPYLKLAKRKKAKTIYENIDNWEDAELGGMLFSADALKQFISKCDVLTATARPLVEQTKKYLKAEKIKKSVYYVANAVDDELFNRHLSYEKPTDLKKGKKTLLYYGSLWGTWFDWHAVFNLAKNHPDYTINLIGDYHVVPERVSRAPKNVHFLGLKTQRELPAYLYYSDIAILPFKVDDIGIYVSPLKIFEYIAMGKPVIATKLPDILDYPNVTYVESLSDWEKAVAKPSKPNLTNADNFTEDNNWSSRATQLLQATSSTAIKKAPQHNLPVSIITLNYNNGEIIFRCIDSILKHSERYNYEIIVVDNQSTDGSFEALKKKYRQNPKVKIIRNHKNGCSSGRNLGVEHATKDYLLFLDSDQWVLHDYWLDTYFNLYSSLPGQKAIGWGAGWFNRRLRSYHVADAFPYAYLPPQYVATSDVGYLGTAGFLIEKSFFNEIGRFDLAYDPTCYEDTDLSLAVRDAGGEIYYCKALGVGHLPHQTTKSGSRAHQQLIRAKGDYFINKWKRRNKKLITKYIK